MANSDRWKKGSAAFKAVMGFEPPEVGPTQNFLRVTVENLFGDIWSRDGLATRDRRLVTLVIVTCLMQGEYMRLHMRAAMENGEFSADELKEIMLHIAHYAGWPVGTFGTAVAEEVAASMK